MRRFTRLTAAALVIALGALGCPPKKDAATNADGGAAPAVNKILQLVSVDERPTLETATPTAAGPFNLKAARNETASTVVQLSGLPKPKEKSTLTLRVQPLQLQSANAQIDPAQVRAYQVLSMPVDANRAGYVRHTGQKASSRTMPRALLPVPMDAGKINVAGLRDPSEPLKPASRIGLSDEPALLWFDVHVPPTAPPGDYQTTIDLLLDGQKLESVPLTLTVYDFVMPVERHLHMVGRIEWASLEALYPDLFENITPHLMKRGDPKYEEAIRLLDQCVALAHEHRTTVVVPRLQPVVKWPLQVFWDEYDSIVEPWLSGSAFPDGVPSGYWPLPHIDRLENFKREFQMQYWAAAVSHFDQKGWAERAWVEVEKETPGRATAAQCVTLSTRVAEILSAHPRLRVSLPLEDFQLQFDEGNGGKLINKQATDRLMTAASGLVFANPGQQAWPQGVVRPQHWLRTDLPGLVPYIGAGGDERDVRLWAWLAWLRQSKVIGWDGALPHSTSPQEAADPNDLTWFYPGRWFGVTEPVPTIQLKWLRRAQQDYEYLHLAQERGQYLSALVVARRMTKPVQTPPNEEPDPTHGLLSGTTDAKAWVDAIELIAKNILLRPPGETRDAERETELGIATQRWLAPQEKPLLIARTASWGRAARPGNWVDLRLGVDTYNAADVALEGEFQWVSAPRAWEFDPKPLPVTQVDAIRTYQVKQFDLGASVDLDRLTAESRKPIQLKFTDGTRSRPHHLSVTVPVAASDKREGKLEINGLLNDWDDAADAIHHGPLVTMLDRPSLQRQAMQTAATGSSVYSNWAAKHFYIAFKLDGIQPDAATGAAGRAEKNDVGYQLRRAWGEDLCEVLVQPVYDQPGDVGQVVRLVCKRNGQAVVAIKPSPKNQRTQGAAAKPVVGADVRYRTTADGGTWRGELAVPWDVINDADHQGQRPTLLRFNFSQHKAATGESASWAGPVDFGQDDTFMGLLYLRDVRSPGMAGE
jgi:hypothetical protein